MNAAMKIQRACIHCDAHSVPLAPVDGLPGELECRNVRLCEKRIREKDPSIGRLPATVFTAKPATASRPANSTPRHLVPVAHHAPVSVIRDAKGDGFVRDVLEAAIEALADANDSYRSGDIVRGLVTVTKTLELYKASFETSRRAYECLIISLRGLGLSLRKEYGQSPRPADLAMATGMRRYDVACAMKLADLPEAIFTQALDSLRSQNVWPSWTAYVGAVKEAMDPSEFERLRRTQHAEAVAQQTKSALSASTPHLREAVRTLKAFTIACGSSINQRSLTRAIGVREAAKIEQTLTSAATVAHDLEARVAISGTFRSTLRTILSAGRSCAALLQVKDDVGPVFLGDVKQDARALLSEVREVAAALEKLVAT